MDTIAVIDDDIYIGDMLEKALSQEGYQVLRAYSGTEALLLFEHRKPDLVLLDLMLPGLAGEQVLGHLKGIPVIVVSARTSVDDKVELLTEGAVDYVTKEIENQRQKVDLSVVKKSSQTGEPLAGVVFGLYADKDGETLLMKAQGDEGIATFSGLRYGTYYLKELQAPEGYSSSAKMRKIVLDEKTRGISDTVTISVENKRNVVTGTGHCAGQIAVVLACALGALLWLRRTMKEN